MLKWIVFIMCFGLDIKIKADLIASTGPSIQEKNFLDYTVRIYPKTIIKTESQRKIHFINGHFLLKTKNNILLKHPYFQADLPKNIDLVVFSKGLHLDYEHKIYLQNISKKSITIFLKDKTEFELPAGFSTWVGPIGRDGKNKWGMVQPIKDQEVPTAAMIYQDNAERMIAYDKALQDEEFNKKRQKQQKRVQQKQDRFDYIFSR